MNLIFVIGPTNAGKSRFLEGVENRMPSKVALVQVGKVLRVRYSPAYFQGQGAPEHTQVEAYSIVKNGIEEALMKGKSICLVDGQPRDVSQLHSIISDYCCANDSYSSQFLNLWAPKDVLIKRAVNRDSGDEEKIKLSLTRLEKDCPNLYFILAELHANFPELLQTINTQRHDPIEWFFDRRFQMRLL